MTFICDSIDLVLGFPVILQSLNSTISIFRVLNVSSQFLDEPSVFDRIDKAAAIGVKFFEKTVSKIQNFLLVII